MIQYDWCPYEKFGHRYKIVRMLCEDEGEIGVVYLQTKEHPKLPGTHHKLGERNGTDSSSEPSEGTNSVDTLI